MCFARRSSGTELLFHTSRPVASDKGLHEREVFGEFAAAAGLELQEESTASENPPRPDISCRLAGETYFFELARLVDSVLPQRVMESIRLLRAGKDGLLGGTASFHKPLIERVREKTGKQYVTDGARVDLLLYYDRAFPAFESPPPGAFVEWANAYMLPEIQKNAGPFSRFWVFDRHSQEVLWRFAVKD